MEMDWIREIYKVYLETTECNEEAMKMEIDLSQLEKKIGRKAAKKLEAKVFDYAAQCQEFMFKNGFMCAWELFSQCSSKSKEEKMRP